MTNEGEPPPMTEEQKLRLKYEVALAQLRLHPALIWTRNNFFLLTQTGLLAFVFNVLMRQDTGPGFLKYLCIAGLFIAVMWLLVNLAGQRLQRNWREIVRVYEAELFKEESQNSKDEKKEPLSAHKSPFHQGIPEGQELSVSITSVLVLLSIGFVALWIWLLVLTWRL